MGRYDNIIIKVIEMEKGYIQVYTGNGKGKTTAALGLSLRAICAGKKVYIGQFMKGMDYSELKAIEYLPNLTINQFGNDKFIIGKASEEDKALGRAGLNQIAAILANGEYDIVVLDELNIALYFELFSLEDFIEVLNKRDPKVEVVITGRNAPQEIIDMADLVTEMKEVKHYYNDGVQARKGIES